MKRSFLLRAAPVAAFALAACGGGGAPTAPFEPGGPGPAPGPAPAPGATVSIALESEGGEPLPWGAPARLRAVVESEAPVDSIVWRSLDDHHLSDPVVLGRGATVSTHALRPGSTRVEGRVWSGGEVVATAVRTVSVAYRESWNVALEGRVAWPNETTGDVWVDSGHAFVARRGMHGLSIVRLDGGPVEVGRFAPAGLFTQDVKVRDGVAYATNEPRVHGYPWGVVAVDVTDPTAPRELGGVPVADLAASAHNVWVEDDVLAIASQGTRDVHLYDVSDPSAPRPLSRVAAGATAHDMLVRGGLLFGSFIPLDGGQRGELTVADVSDPAAPRVLARVHWPGAFTHSSWLSADGRALYVLDELVNASIRIYDVSSPADPRLVDTYQPRLGTIPHNLLVKDGRTAYLANYKNGVEILDVSDPFRPRLIGFYDTHPGVAADDGVGSLPGQGFSRAPVPAHEKGRGVYEGAWGVHWDDAGRIVVSDLTGGLFVLRYTGP